MIKKIFCVATLLVSTAASAGQWSDPLTIEELWTEGTTDIIGIKTSEGKEYTTGCLVNLWLFKADTEHRRSRAYSTLMAAQMSGNKVQIWYSDACTFWSFHEGTIVKLLK